MLVTLPILGILLNGATLDSANRRCYWFVLLSEMLGAVFLQVPRERELNPCPPCSRVCRSYYGAWRYSKSCMHVIETTILGEYE